MCEYAKVVNEGNKPSVTMCEATGTLCTYCVLGNAEIYLRQKYFENLNHTKEDKNDFK